jgi:hypothetical protein
VGNTEKTIIRLLEYNPGLSDKEIAHVVKARSESPQYINQKCRFLESEGFLQRKKREDGLIGNFLTENGMLQSINQFGVVDEASSLMGKKIKKFLETYLSAQGWETRVAWGFTHGVDIEARRGKQKWIIEVKGTEPLYPMPVGAFVSVLGEVLQRMDDPACKYSVAFPEAEQFRRLWERLPPLAKQRTGITALFVTLMGDVIEEKK